MNGQPRQTRIVRNRTERQTRGTTPKQHQTRDPPVSRICLCSESAYIDVTADRTSIKWQIGQSNKSRRLCALNHIALQHYRTATSAVLITEYDLHTIASASAASAIDRGDSCGGQCRRSHETADPSRGRS